MSKECNKILITGKKPVPLSPLHAEILEPGFSSYEVRKNDPKLNIREFMLNGDVNTVRYLLKREGIEHGSPATGNPIQTAYTIAIENWEKMKKVLQQERERHP